MADEKNKTGIIGLGYVGLPLVLDFCEAGLEITGFDIDDSKVEALRNGESYISYIPGEHLNKYINSGLFEPTSILKGSMKLTILLLLSLHRWMTTGSPI